MRLSHLPLRLTTGAFILNSGIGKVGMDPQSAQGLHGMAAGAIPAVRDVKPTTFVRALSGGEIALGTALLLPFVSPVVAGAGLAAFGGGLVQLYLRTPGLRKEGSIAPTEAGLGIAKDVWMLAMGMTLVYDGLTEGARGAARRARKSVKKARRKASRSVSAAIPAH